VSDGFFDVMEEQSKIKSIIVEKYFDSWVKIIEKRSKQFAYIDLFSGPGVYKDGNESTPIKILKLCIKNNYLDIITVFNDKDRMNIEVLENNVRALPGIENLKIYPQFLNNAISHDISSYFKEKYKMPSFSFVDPCGYEGLTYDLINSLTRDWGCDCVFFFNFNRVNMALTNDKVEDHINKLFTIKVANRLRSEIKNLAGDKREELIIKELCYQYSYNDLFFVLPFKFVFKDKDRTSHYLIFVTKNSTAYKIMKEIMWSVSSTHIDNIGSFSFKPNNSKKNTQMNLFSQLDALNHSLDEILLKDFRGQSLKVKQIYEKHNKNTPFVLKNYKEALLRLEEKGKIKAFPEKRRINTMGDDVMIKFK